MKKLVVGIISCVATVAFSSGPLPPYGVCAPVTSKDRCDYRLKETLAAAELAGARYIRSDFYCYRLKTKDGGWDFSTYDGVVDKLEQQGVTLLPIIYNNAPATTVPPSNLESWKEYVATIVRHYGKRLPVVEIWNEPNLDSFYKGADPVSYAATLRAAYQAIKEVDSDICVAYGGLAGVPISWIRKTFEAGVTNCFDIMNVHPYSHPAQPEGALDVRIEQLQELMAEFGIADRPIWLTEVGWPTQAKTIPFQNILLSGLKLARPLQTKWKVVLCDTASVGPVDQTMAIALQEVLPPGSEVVVCSQEDASDRLEAGGVDAIAYPFDETFPADLTEAVCGFIRRGGVFIDFGGMPCYFGRRDGESVQGMQNGAAIERFPFGFRAWWTDEPGKYPEHAQVFVTERGKSVGVQQEPTGFTASRFLAPDRIGEGAEWIPLIAGKTTNGVDLVSAAVVRYGGSGGAAVLCSLYPDRNAKSATSEEDQARFTARAMGISFAKGIQAYFAYNLRASEDDPFYSEDHFGLMHADFTPKPAFAAYGQFVRMRPEGSVNLPGPWHDAGRLVFAPQWRRPDGRPGGMIWSIGADQKRELRFSAGEPVFYDLYGKRLPSGKRAQGVYCQTIGKAPIYFVGARLEEAGSRDLLRPVAQEKVKVLGRVGAMQDRFFAERIFSDFAKNEIWKEARAAFERPDDDVFKKPVGMWKGEFWGKLMISACRVATYSGDEGLKRFLHDECLRLISLQHSDGYLGTYVDKEFVVPRPEAAIVKVPGTSSDWNWNLWCRKYTLWGLLSCYRLTGDERILAAADRAMEQQISMLRRLGLKLCDTGTTCMRGLPPCSILKPLLWLYDETGKREYLDYAREIVGYWDEEGNRAPQFFKLAATGKPMYTWYPDEIGLWGKAYEMMSCLDGLLEYYRVTGERRVLELVKSLQRDIRENEMNPCLSVGYNDQFTGAARHLNGVTEPCDAVHWMRLNHDLFLLTGDPAYVDALELTFYNAFLAGMRPDGKWGARCVRSHCGHYAAPPQSGMVLQHCCVNNFPRGFMDVAQTVAAEMRDGTTCICLYHDAKAELSNAVVEISGGFPVRDGIKVSVTRKSDGKVRFRVPGWCDRLILRADGVYREVTENCWVDFDAAAGESIWELEFGLKPRIVKLKRSPFVPGEMPDLQSPRWPGDPANLRKTPAAEIMYGPLLLAKSVKVGDDESQIMDPNTISGGEWCVSLLPKAVPDDVWSAWTLVLEKDGERKTFGVCDFPSAAEWKDERSEFSLFF